MSSNFHSLRELIGEPREEMSASWHQSGDAACSFFAPLPPSSGLVVLPKLLLAFSPRHSAPLPDSDTKWFSGWSVLLWRGEVRSFRGYARLLLFICHSSSLSPLFILVIGGKHASTCIRPRMTWPATSLTQIWFLFFCFFFCPNNIRGPKSDIYIQIRVMWLEWEQSSRISCNFLRKKWGEAKPMREPTEIYHTSYISYFL